MSSLRHAVAGVGRRPRTCASAASAGGSCGRALLLAFGLAVEQEEPAHAEPAEHDSAISDVAHALQRCAAQEVGVGVRHPRVDRDVGGQVDHARGQRRGGEPVGRHLDAARAGLGDDHRRHESIGPARRRARAVRRARRCARPAAAAAESAGAARRRDRGPARVPVAASGSSAALRISSRAAISSPKSVNSRRARSFGDRRAAERRDRVADRVARTAARCRTGRSDRAPSPGRARRACPAADRGGARGCPGSAPR